MRRELSVLRPFAILWSGLKRPAGDHQNQRQSKGRYRSLPCLSPAGSETGRHSSTQKQRGGMEVEGKKKVTISGTKIVYFLVGDRQIWGARGSPPQGGDRKRGERNYKASLNVISKFLGYIKRREGKIRRGKGRGSGRKRRGGTGRDRLSRNTHYLVTEARRLQEGDRCGTLGNGEGGLPLKGSHK